MKKRFLAVVLVISMLLSAIPFGTVMTGAAETPSDVTITVLDSQGKPITDSSLAVTVTHVYGSYFTRSQNVTVTNYSGGVFGYDSSDYNRTNTKYYQIKTTLTENGRTYSDTVQVAKNVTSVVVTLEDFIQEDEWATFDIYYIADGHFPNNFYGHGDAADYGPAGDNTPLLSIKVNLTKLQSDEYSDCVLYQQNVSNAYHFIPAQQSESEDATEKYEENLKYATKFWNAVKACMDKESIDAFEATGLYDTFIGYCLKNQGSVSNPDNHCDGILSVKPPVYVIEMYDHEGNIFGGYTNDKSTINSKPTSMSQVLEAYNKHFNQEIIWTDEGNGVWSGSYITSENGRKYRYNLQIVQTNVSAATGFTSDAGIKYQKKTNTYYLAAFQSKTQSIERVDYIVTYTDGVKDLVFNDQVTSLDKGKTVVPFEGNTHREDFIFLGWTLEGGDGTVLSQEEILAKYTSVNEDITFVAIYMAAPEKHIGTVEVILDGYYDSENATATGEKIDITEVLGDDISLYVSADGVEFIPLVRNDKGVYSAELLNGNYGIYYYDGTDYTLSSDQHLSINNDDRTRYLFFEYVTYNLNGGVGGPESLLEYYHTGAEVKVSSSSPTRKGYLFAGWKDQNGNIYNGGDILTSAIGEKHTLKAIWEDAADIFVNVTINHDSSLGYDNSASKDDIKLNLVYTPDLGTPYLETGDSIVLSDKNHEKHSYTYEPEDANDKASKLKTVYTANGPTVSGVSKDYSYSVSVIKHNYSITSVHSTVADNGDVVIDVVLDYSPQNHDLQFEVKVADSVPNHLIPQAAIVKIANWSTELKNWEIIAEHTNTDEELKPGIRVDINSETRTGSGYYPVWASEILEDNSILPYGYRIVVTALVYPDGSIVSMNQDALVDMTKDNTDIYYVTYGDVSEGKAFGSLNGAYFENETQKGKLNAVITADAFDVTFDAKGGTVNGYDKDTSINQYKVPSFGGYVASRNGGYVFDGWYKDTSCTIPAVEGEYLKSDITLYAKWKEPLTVEGLITVGATYEQLNEDSSVTIQKIPELDWAKTVLVMLQKIEPNGYTETIAEKIIDLDYSNSDYYNGDRIVGFANYSFGEIPDIGLNYRVQVLVPNYHPTFQHEDESLNDALNYRSYNHEDFTAEFGTTAPTVATVNVHTHFSPEEFELKYSVNAEAIGDGFRPYKTEILVTCDDYHSGAVPSEWAVISQMVFGDKLFGDIIELTNGKGNGSDKVWIRRADGISIYEYGIRIKDVVLADGTTTQFSDSLPFTVEYQAPAYHTADGQSQELIATLKPKTYSISYVTNGGSLSGDYPTEHTWSYDTDISGVVPTFSGFKFDGWYLDKELTKPANDHIDASVSANTTLYAKWIQVMDVVNLKVTIKHNLPNTASGLASNYNKTLFAQLTFADRLITSAEQVYIDMPNHTKEYPDGQWHTNGDKVKEDIFEVPSFYTHLSSEYDYGVNVMLEGYYVSEKKIEKVKQPDGSTLHIVNITLQYNPDIFDLHFYVNMADDVPKGAYPQSAEVKVTSWYDDPAADTDWDWFRITQHEFTTITVNIDPQTGRGTGTYPVWHWYDESLTIPYYYRMEVIQLNFADGTAVRMNETIADVSYSGGGYNAEIKVDGGKIPSQIYDNQPTTTLSGVYAEGEGYKHDQKGTVGAVIGVNKVVFHANNPDAIGFDSENDAFRTYYPTSSKNELYTLNKNGTISPFYEIPEFQYDTHNKYIFKGWYLDKDSEENPLNWNTVFDETTHIYAHWIETGTVAKENDNKQTAGDTYQGFDLIGVQIRDKAIDTGNYYGTPASGLRFITALSEDVYAQINAIAGNSAGAEYGFVLARATTAQKNAGDDQNYTLQYKGENVNGIDTTSTHSYVQNLKCSGIEDHYNGENYRLYTAVITYKNYTGDRLEQEYNQSFAARAYLRYFDANGIERIHYNNYTGTHFYGGCSTSFAAVRNAVNN